MTTFNFEAVDPSWIPFIHQALGQMEPGYLNELLTQPTWLPGKDKIFNAFSLPYHKVRFVLFGESPYPRLNSANGYAFWDGAVHHLWSQNGLAKEVNRATSLRNIIKMLLVADGKLAMNNLSQTAIANINKHNLIQTIDELFFNFMNQGIILLNATLVLHHEGTIKMKYKDAKAWQPFIESILRDLSLQPDIQLILLGKIAKEINNLSSANYFSQFHAEHPYNYSFITNKAVLDFFRPLKLLEKV